MEKLSVMIYGTISPEQILTGQGLTVHEKMSIRESLEGMVSDQEIDLMLDAISRTHKHTDHETMVAWAYGIFASQGNLKYFQKPCARDATRSNLSETLDLRTLITTLHVPDHFYILSLEREVTRLYYCDPLEARELPLQEGLRTHVVKKNMSSGYFTQLDGYLIKLLRNDDGLVFIAGTGYGQAIFRAITHLRNVDPVTLPSILTKDDLTLAFQRASLTIELHYREQVAEAKRRYYSSAAQGLTSESPAAIVEYAKEGRVDTLFVSDRLDGTLTDEAVKQAIISDAAIHLLSVEDMPAPSLAALLKQSQRPA